ncbi:alpha/beta hydrolase family protein [Streptomyces gilvosporeus]|uniref:Alpha/beta hydrolase n=1 Tax=Streptomyces gilvosporeus TaxID=553510 RepID=A0A1V0TVZ1_9ACTN|nr:alpha/beta hydrolase [Streptomyces gilvosporeus]ARF57063.1 alpha/beta hydrolase [Streptomyces gilvosporeus]
MKSIRRSTAVLAALALALPLPLAAAGTALATPSATTAVAATSTPSSLHLKLPRPTGPYAIGRDTLHLVDTSRRDPWVPSAGARELMVSMFYPAHAGSGAATAPYMTTKEAQLLLEKQQQGKNFPPEVLSGTRTHAHTGARPLAGRHPLVVLSPGFSLNRATLTLLSEELTSRGYVVALVDHAYETFGTTFPGGRTLTCVACDTVEHAPSKEAAQKLMTKVAEGRAADVSFLLDALTGRHHTEGAAAARKYARLIDPHRIGMAGHSIGGNSAATAMAADRRIRAGVNMDGSFFAPVPRSGLNGRPFLMLGSKAGHSPASEDTTWPRDWRRLDGWKRWLTVADAGHFTFIDIPVLAAQAGIVDPSAPLPGKRSGEITRDYVGAFFDQQLRGIHRPLLDGPTAANPEVSFQNP